MTVHVSAGSRPDALLHLPLEDLAVRVAAYQWWEQRLFALTGEWAPRAIADPRATVLLDRFSAEHAWHAQLWSERQPLPPHLSRLAGADPPAPIPGYLARFEEIGATADPGSLGPVVLGMLARSVLPRVVATYRAHLARSDATSGGPEARVLRHVLADEIEEWLDAEAAVQSMVGQAPVAVQAEIADACGQLDAVVAATGQGLLGWKSSGAQRAAGRGS